MAILIREARSVEACNERTHRGCTARPFQSRKRQLLIGKIFSLVLFIAAYAVTTGASNGHTQSPPVSEYQIKAAFLYNFAKFIEWPAEAFKDANASIILGVVGEDPFGSILEQTIKGKTSNGRGLVIKRLKRDQDLKACHILFISSSERKHLGQIIESLKGSSVLTVGEMEQFTQLGGIIKFTVEENKVRFEINADMAERTGMKISSKLLALAKVSRDGHHGGKR